MQSRAILSRKPRLPGKISAISAFIRRADRAPAQTEPAQRMIHQDRLSLDDPHGESAVDKPSVRSAAPAPMALPERYPVPLRPSTPDGRVPPTPDGASQHVGSTLTSQASVASVQEDRQRVHQDIASAPRSRLSFFGFSLGRSSARQTERVDPMALFIAYARSRRMQVSFRPEEGKFVNPVTQEAWLAWQAAQPAAGHGTVINMPSPAPAMPIDKTSLETLTLIVQRLASQLQRAEPSSPYPDRALDFLVSHKLLGEPERPSQALLAERQG